MFQRGNILRLSQEGLDYIYKYDPAGRARASRFVFEFRGKTRKDLSCSSVRRIGGKHLYIYHQSFLEKVT